MNKPGRRTVGGPSRQVPARKQVSFNNRIAQKSAQKPSRKGLWGDVESPQQDESLSSPESPLFPELELERQNSQLALQLEQSKIDRMGDEVEAFAERLDEWQSRRDRISEDDPQRDAKRIKEANQLLDDLQAVAREKHATSHRDHSRREPLSKTWRGRIAALQDSASPEPSGRALQESSVAADDELEDLRERKAEVDTWGLFRKLTAIQSSKLTSEFKQHYEKEHPIHKFSPDEDLWTRFILFDDSARERKVVLEWLEHTAQTSETTFDAIIEQMESHTGTGSGTWSHGWLHTREKIKAEKRLRSMAGAASVQQAALRATDSSDTLVTQLDPDAPSRQKCKLEKQDDHYERSIWLACYEMLRRGMPWDEVREWFEDRKEGWRGASLGVAQDLDRKSSRLCLGGPHAGALWRRMCLTASRQSSAEKYERAVYGLLAGDIESVEPVCESWRDLVYARYNSLLLGSFEGWLQKNFPDRFPSVLAQRLPIYQPVSPYEDVEDYRQLLLDDILQRPEFLRDAHKPSNWVQAVLITGSFHILVNDLGITLAQKAAESGSKMIPRPSHGEGPVHDYRDFAERWDALRVVVHMIIIFKEAGMEFAEGVESNITNIFGGYIDVLRLLGKINAIPTYARFIQKPYQTQLLALVLYEVTNHSEQEQLVGLMGQHKLAITDILSNQFSIALDRLHLGHRDVFESIERFDIVEPAIPRWAGFRIQPGFRIASDADEDNYEPFISEDEARLVRGVEWFFRCKSTWRNTFFALTFVQLQLLRSGHHHAALAVARAVPFKKMSMKKSPIHLGQAVDVFEEPEFLLENDDTKVRYTLELLRQQSRQYMELEQLCHAIGALAAWRTMETDLQEMPDTLLHTRDVRYNIKDALADLSSKIEPLLHDFLTRIAEEDWVEPIGAIRKAYLPEIILAYIGAITFAAEFCGAETILKSLNLANIIASDSNTELAETFLEAGRMEDLVTALALSSRRLLFVNQNVETDARRAKKAAQDRKGTEDAEVARKQEKIARKVKSSRESLVKKRGWAGETLDIWDPNKIFAEGM